MKVIDPSSFDLRRKPRCCFFQVGKSVLLRGRGRCRCQCSFDLDNLQNKQDHLNLQLQQFLFGGCPEVSDPWNPFRWYLNRMELHRCIAFQTNVGYGANGKWYLCFNKSLCDLKSGKNELVSVFSYLFILEAVHTMIDSVDFERVQCILYICYGPFFASTG